MLGVSILVVTFVTPVALTSSALALGAHQSSIHSTALRPHVSMKYSVGTLDSSQPSGEAPPTISEIPGYQLSYVTNFSGNSLPPGWIVFSGKPSGDPGSQWANNHVIVSGDMLQLNTFRDPNFNNEWVSGGICHCGDSHTYGAFFVRSRMTGPGPTQVEMLWPGVGWPPEIDFNETYNGISASQATLHYASANLQIHKNINIDMTAWHTWGVIWTPTSITYTVDGNVWGTVTNPSVIPHQPMTLHIQQQTWCSSGFACPTSPQSTDINWVADYASTSIEPISLGSFAGTSAALSSNVKARVRHLANVIVGRSDTSVKVLGYANGSMSQARALVVSGERASNVKRFLELQLASLNDLNVSIVAIGVGASTASPNTINARVNSGKAVAMFK
jgi:outer membrane protein OmpA-like peptidoglycan-associated protein